MITKAVVLKLAGSFGLVCSTGTLTYVAHEPIKRAVHRVVPKPAPQPVRIAKIVPYVPAPIPEIYVAPLPEPDMSIDVLPVCLPQGSSSDNGSSPTAGGPSDTGFFEASSPNTGGGLVVIPGVPETSTWMMLVLGFGGIGYKMRKNNSLFRERNPLSVHNNRTPPD